jgi:hypothetical protein
MESYSLEHDMETLAEKLSDESSSASHAGAACGLSLLRSSTGTDGRPHHR